MHTPVDEKKKVIKVADNGRGMDIDGLKHFFTMHAENINRRRGKIGRGLFGTGKSAAFGIADQLQVSSVKDGKRTTARLCRSDVDCIKDGSPIPVQMIEKEKKTGEPNGTVVTISGIHLGRIDRPGIIKFIERNLARCARDVEVFVDHHQCQFKAPEVAEERSFEAEGDIRRLLGSAKLKLKIAKGPLAEELRGVAVYSHGNWHTTTLAGAERKKMAEFIFGEIDVPALEEYEGPIAPFDNTRSGELNPNNKVVQALFRFLGPQIDRVRRKLVARERECARSEEAQKLAEQAAQISEILSRDFSAFQAKLRKVQSAAAGRDLGKKFDFASDNDVGPLVEGGDKIATRPQQERNSSEGNGGRGNAPPDIPTPVEADAEGETTGTPRGGQGSRKRGRRGGLSIEHRELGEDQPRGEYSLDHRTITINLDHPQVAAAKEMGGVDTDVFSRLTAEIATAEYAVALAQELVETYSIADEAIFDIHDTIDRVSRQFATLYSPASG